jgi:hypothetical protein
MRSKPNKINTKFLDHKKCLSIQPLLGYLAFAIIALSNTAQAAKPQQVIWSEDFQNIDIARSDFTSLLNYSGLTPAGQKYTAHANWLPAANTCNGLLVSANLNTASASGIAACNADPSPLRIVQQLAYAFEQSRNPTATRATKKANYALTAFTNGANPGSGNIQFETLQNIPLSASTRFIMSSVETAATSCFSNHPLFRFYLLNQSGTEIPLSTSNEDACSDSDGVSYNDASKAHLKVPVISLPDNGDPESTASIAIFVSTKTSNQATKFSGTSIGYRIRNFQASGTGNDGAIDNPKILDVTPTVDKSFSVASIPLGSTSNLVYTITNTTDLAAKAGWDFTDALPSGLSVAGAASTTCTGATLVAPSGATSVSITGSLAASVETCTVTVPVQASNVGSFTTTSSNYTALNYLNADQPATLTVTASADMRSTTLVPAGIVAGQLVTVQGVCTNYGPSAAVSPTCSLSGLPAGAPAATCSAAPASLAVGSSITCSSTFTVPGNGNVDANTTAASGTYDPSTPNNASSASVAVAPRSDMVAQVTGFPASSPAGVPVSGSVTCTNAGPSIATNASCGVSTSPTAGVTVSCPAYPITLAVGASTSCTVSYTPPGGAPANFTVTGTASSANTDPAPGNNQSSQSVGVVPQADMQAVTSVPASVNAGQSITVSGTCTNAGPSSAEAPTCVLSGLPTGTTQSCTPAVASLASGSAITCTSSAFTVPASGTVTVVTTAGATTHDPNASNDSNSKALVVVAQADMQASITGVNASALAGSNVTATATCLNAGPSTAVNASCNVSGLPSGATVSCLPSTPVSSLPSGSNIQCTVNYAVPVSGSLSISATAGSTTQDPNTGNNTASSPQNVNAVSDMQASIHVPAVIKDGDTVTVTGTCTNGGPSAAQAPSCVLGGLPVGSTAPVCTPALPMASLSAGSSITCTSSITPRSAVTLTTTAGTSTSESNLANNTASTTPVFVPQANLKVELSGFPPNPLAGATVNGTLTCTNQGPSVASNVHCSAQSLPSGAVVGACVPPSPLTSLAVGSSMSCPITYTVGVSGEVAITGVVQSDTPDPDPADNFVQVRLNITPLADIRSTTTLSAASINAGDTVTVTGRCANYGPSVADSATCALSGLPPGATQVCSPDPVPGVLPVYNPSLVPGDAGYGDGVITCTSTFLAPGSGNFTIYTSGHSLTGDDAPINNTSSAPLAPVQQADMQVILSGFPNGDISAGATVTGTITCKNAGPSAATSASCTHSGLPSGATMLCAPSSPANILAVGSEMKCSVSFVAPTTASVQLTATAANTVNDPNTGNNEKSQTWNVTPSADMIGTVTLPASASAGQTITVTGTCTNAGPSTATAATCVLSGLPSGATQTCTPTSPTTLTATAPGNSITCSSTFTVASSGTLPITATAFSTTQDPTPSNNPQTKNLFVAPVADMTVTLSGFPPVAYAGQTVDGFVTCTNLGPNPASNATCTVTGVPIDVAVICTPSTPLNPLPVGHSISCRVSYTFPSTGGTALTVTGRAGSDATDPQPANNTAQAVVAFSLVAPTAIPLPRSLIFVLTLLFAALAWAGRKHRWGSPQNGR